MTLFIEKTAMQGTWTHAVGWTHAITDAKPQAATLTHARPTA